MSQSQDERAEGAGQRSTIWMLVDHSARAPAFEAVAEALERAGHAVEVVTITEALGSMARDVFTGGAERVLRSLRVAIQGKSDEDLLGAVRRVRPDVLVVTNPRHTRALSLLEGLANTPVLQVGVLPDYNLSQAWLKSGLSAFVVPHREMSERLERAQVPASRLFVAGPAVAPPFAAALDKGALRAEFGFPDAERVVLVRAETLDVATLEKVVFQAKLVEGAVRFVFHHNGDGAAASALRRAASEYGLPAVMFGRVEDIERYMVVADMVLTSAADPMMPEIMALGLPAMMVGSAQEWGEQAEFLERHKMGRLVPDVLRLGAELERFLRPEILEGYTQGARATGLPGGSDEVAAALEDILRAAPSWQANTQESARQDGPQKDGGDSESAARGPFETIGSGASNTSQGAGQAPQGGSASGGGAGGAGATGSDYVGISRAEAKEQLAQLILAERDLERRLGDLEKEQQRWRSRLDLARQWNEEDLAREAEEVLRAYLNEAKPLQQELDGIRRQKQKLKAAAGGNRPQGEGEAGASTGRQAELERRFRKMEEDRDLDSLKDRIGREFDD